MRVLFVSGFSTPRCGEAVFGALMADALEEAGVEVVRWDGAYPALYARQQLGLGYLPYEAEYFDLIHLNWGPANMGHFLPEHFPAGVPLSLFLHDVPPNSTCSLWDRAALRMAYERAPGVVVVPHAIPAWTPLPQEVLQPPHYSGRMLGVTGIRDDPGFALVRGVAFENGWAVLEPPWWSGGPWLSVEEEIGRLSTCQLNVCWYHTSGRGKSMAASFCLASRRPLLLSGSSMFSHLWPYEDEIHIVRHTHEGSGGGVSRSYAGSLGPILETLLSGQAVKREPKRVLEEMSWRRRALEIKALWEGML